ncbi:GlxA family transcriptional regulator [Pelagibius sp. Alg239-R121]|uniref:GlxA family transcriptional regulator n=1 Tax=Pelagibius sp. Alg239-R121 TaxID=2993448 RepID=UPI0024A63CD4|nr:helix-turn-helix domain-containing protein [Pelagibius sp. Alg239-R121]
MIVVYPGVTLLDAAGPAQVFSSANDMLNREGKEALYQLLLTSPLGGDIETDTGIVLKTLSLQNASKQPIDTMIISGGVGVFDLLEENRFLKWVVARHAECRRVATTCMGAFVTAKAGLLDGESVATHWRYAEDLQCQHPEAQVEKDPLFVRSGKMWSAAGVTSGIDLALAMVEEDLDHRLAMLVAQSLVVFFKRPGGQSQFSNVLNVQKKDEAGTFSELHAWIAENLRRDLSIEVLAQEVRMSPRTFARRYKERTGVTPARSVEMMRVDSAKRMLELEQDLPLAKIARNTGLADEQRLRRAFVRHMGISPLDYRAKFGAAVG